MSGNLIQANAIQIPLKDKSVQLCAFSPPYWSLRKFAVDPMQFPDGYVGQLGLEPSIDLYLDHLMLVMGEAWRVLRDDGVCFVNLADTYNSAPGGYRHTGDFFDRPSRKFTRNLRQPLRTKTIPPKSLCLIPQKFAIRCQEIGWTTRSEIIWHKPNPMPESCKDRPTKAHEQVWMMVKQGKYFWDQEAVREFHKPDSIARMQRGRSNNHKWDDGGPGNHTIAKDLSKACHPNGRNIRSVWTLPTESQKAAHFACWPSKLVEIMVRAGSSPKTCEICGSPWKRIVEKEFVSQEDVSIERGIRCALGQKSLDETDNRSGFPRGSNQTKTIGWQPTCTCRDNKGTGKCVVLDPFVGVGTSVLVAEKLGRVGVGLDLSAEYLWNIAKEKVEASMQKELF